MDKAPSLQHYAAARLKRIHSQLVARKPPNPADLAFLRGGLSRYLGSDKPYDLARPLGLAPARRGTTAPRKLAGEPRWLVDGAITESGIGMLRLELRDEGTVRKHGRLENPHPDDVIATLRAISARLSGDRPLTKAMSRYLRTALGRYLGPGALTIEQAFGLKLVSKRPPLPLETRQAIAGKVLHACLRYGYELKYAARVISGEPGCPIGKTQVLQCWKEHKLEAIHLAKQALIDEDPNRRLRSYPWRPAEKRVLQRLFARDYAKLRRAGITFAIPR